VDAEAIRDIFSDVLPVRVTRLFGGHGIYDGELIFAIQAGGEIYLKTSDATRQLFVDAGSAPFVYRQRNQPRDLGYWKLPEAALDDTDILRHWVGLALQAARERAAGKVRRRG
jgi:DNA transformation protein